MEIRRSSGSRRIRFALGSTTTRSASSGSRTSSAVGRPDREALAHPRRGPHGGTIRQARGQRSLVVSLSYRDSEDLRHRVEPGACAASRNRVGSVTPVDVGLALRCPPHEPGHERAQTNEREAVGNQGVLPAGSWRRPATCSWRRENPRPSRRSCFPDCGAPTRSVRGTASLFPRGSCAGGCGRSTSIATRARVDHAQHELSQREHELDCPSTRLWKAARG